MKKLSLFLVVPALCLVFASRAAADTLNFTVTSSVEGIPFTISFTEPSTINSLTPPLTSATLNSPVLNFTDPATFVEFFPTSQAGLFNLDMSDGIETFDFEFFGPQSYSGTGPFTLLTGTFPLGANGTTGFLTQGDEEPFPLDPGGKVVVTGGTSTPEPGTFALLGLGLTGLAALRRKLRIA